MVQTLSWLLPKEGSTHHDFEEKQLKLLEDILDELRAINERLTAQQVGQLPNESGSLEAGQDEELDAYE